MKYSMDDKLCFVKLIGKENDEYYRYEFFFSKNINNFDVVEDYFPCCLSDNIIPIDNEYEIHTLKTKIKFDLIQNNCCFSFRHCMDGCVALAIENVDTYTEYPEDGRLFFMFGESYDRVEEKLAMKHLLFVN